MAPQADASNWRYCGKNVRNTTEKIIRNKVGVLELAKQLGSVSQACRIMGFSRDSFYRFKELYEKGGESVTADLILARSWAAPLGWTGSGCGFDRLPGVVILEL